MQSHITILTTHLSNNDYNISLATQIVVVAIMFWVFALATIICKKVDSIFWNVVRGSNF
jgi:hypothetical protein